MSRHDDAGGDDKRAVAGDEDTTLHWQPVLCTLHLNFCASGSTTTTTTAAAASTHASRNNSNNNNNNSNSNTATFVRADGVYSGISVIRYRKERLPHDAHARRQPHDHNEHSSSHDTACAVHDDTALQPSHTSAARAPSAAATTTTVSAYDAFAQLRRRVAALHGLPLHAQTRTTTPPPSSSSSASLLLSSSPPRDNDKDSSSTARGLTVQSYKVAILTSSGRLPLRVRAVTELSLSADAAADDDAVDDNGGDDTRHDKRAAAAVDNTTTDTTDTRHNNHGGGRGAVRVATHGKAAHEQQRHNNNSSSNSKKQMRCGQHAAPRTTAAAAAATSSSCATKVVQFDRAASLPAGTLVELTVHFTGVVGAVNDGSSSGGGIYAAEAASSSSSSCRAALTSSNCNTHVSQPPHSHTSARTATAATTATTAALLTHFEVALARRAFACPDDVHHRLEWQLATLQLPACYTAAFCNGATLRHTKALHAQRAVQYSFARCGPLPAYALAFAAFASSSSSSLCAAAPTACVSSPLDMVTSAVTLPSATHFVRARRHRRRAHAAAMTTPQQQQQGHRQQQQRCHDDDDDSSSDDDDDDTHNNGSSSSSSGGCADTASVDVPLCVAAMRGRGVSHATLQRVLRLTSTAVRVLQRYFACPLPLLQCSRLCVLLVPMLPYVSGMEHHACIFLRDDMFVLPSSSSTTTAAATATAGTRPVQRRPHNNNNNNKNDNDDDEDESFDAAALAAQAGLIVHEVAHHWIGNAIGVPFAVKEGVCQLLESVFSATLLHGHDSNNSSNNNNNNSAHATRNAAKATGTTAAAPQQQPSDGKRNATTTTSSSHSAAGRPRRGSGSGAFDVAEVAHGREFTSHTYQSALAAMQRVVAQHGMARVSRGLRRVVRRHVTRVMAAREAAAAAEYGGASYSSNNNNNDDGDDDSGYCGCNIATLTASHDADGYSGDDAYDVRMLTDAAAAGDDNGVSTTPPYLSSKAFMRYLCDEHR